MPVVLGWDAAGPLAVDLEEAWKRALNGENGVGPLTRFQWPEGFPVTAAGQVDDFDAGPYPFLAPRKLALWPSPVFKYSMLVAHRALEHAGLDITPDIAADVGVTFSPAVGGLDQVLAADRVLQREGRLPKPYVNPNSCINMVTGKLAIMTGAKGPNVSTITACATGSTSLVVGALFIASGMAKAVICGGVDFPLVEPIVAGFATMNGAYQYDPDRPEPPQRASRPFSIDRRGFVVSEGAGALILASEEFARAHGLSWDVELAGWHMNGDAHHYVAPSLPTVTRCMAGAIEHAGLSPKDIDAINAHAASTKAGDQVEAEALHQVFGDEPPPMTANKSQMGHTMGAASAIESIFSVLGLRDQILPPTLNLNPDPALGLDNLSGQARPTAQTHVLKNAFGFGGTNCCLVFKRRA